MRIGIRLVGAVAGAAIVAMTATFALGAASEEVKHVPLGGSLTGQQGDRYFGVYVPTRFGGVLTIKASSGTVEEIVGPDGKTRKNGEEVGTDQQGWYRFKVGQVEPDSRYTVETSFVQLGLSKRLPWNFYYWPTKADAIHEPWAGGNGRVDTMQPLGDDQMVASPGGYIAPGQDIIRAGPNGLLETPASPGDTITWFPNLYDDLTFRGADGTIYATPSPMLKYDQIFGSTARNWEAANSQNQDIQRWPGHCLGGAVASIMLEEPIPAPGSGFTQDELKSLWAESGENHYNHQIGDYANEIPPGPPRPGFDATDAHAPRFHNMLETHIRGNRQNLLGNLRAFPPRGTVNEVWNHGIGKFIATYHAIPGKGERSVRLEVEVYANSGSNLNNEDPKPRMVKYEYTLVYGLDGKIDLTNAFPSDWISVGGEGQFCPLNILEVVSTRWQGHNPYITEANIRSIDMANGGSGGRFARTTAPTWRPVNSYEAGRAPLFASGNNRIGDASAASPRRGLFRLFGGR
ncbi:hypothetical protein P12x_005574 [Tundrisphaera lichenicola]|uniref:hypothetical protein n=1 Tax=Tundrisphaera lichenicola TaxID=2029860 RepID=UPI003EBC60BA